MQKKLQWNFLDRKWPPPSPFRKFSGNSSILVETGFPKVWLWTSAFPILAMFKRRTFKAQCRKRVGGGWAGELWQRLGLRGVQRCRGEGLRAPEGKSPLYNSATLLSSVPLCSTNLLSKTTTLCNCALCNIATLLLCSATRVWGWMWMLFYAAFPYCCSTTTMLSTILLWNFITALLLYSSTLLKADIVISRPAYCCFVLAHLACQMHFFFRALLGPSLGELIPLDHFFPRWNLYCNL